MTILAVLAGLNVLFIGFSLLDCVSKDMLQPYDEVEERARKLERENAAQAVLRKARRKAR